MDTYEINKNFGLVKLPVYLTSDFEDSMKEVRKDNIVNSSLSDHIGQINDYEMASFSPCYDAITFDIYFHRRVNAINDTDFRSMLSTAYAQYYDLIKDYFLNYSIKGVDPISIPEYPTFWNSFGYPFASQKESWYEPLSDGTPSTTLKSNRFDAQSYLYNSFLKMNFYTTPYPVTQELLFQNVIYVNPRWCSLEGDDHGMWHRPTFNLDPTTDGYFIYWLNKYNIDSFYVTFQFWDALNGQMINLLPSRLSDASKHWVQSVNHGFDSRTLYVRYDIGYASKVYEIRLFETDQQEWTTRSSEINLYELIFDDNFYDKNPNISVGNGTVEVVPNEPTITTTTFNAKLDSVVANIPPISAIHSVEYDDNISFQTIRSNWKSAVAGLDSFYETINLTNTGNEPFYLKRIGIELIDSTHKKTRLSGYKKRTFEWEGKLMTSYGLFTVPNWKMSQNYGLQPHFDQYYFPKRNNKSTAGNKYGWTVAVKGQDDNQQDWWYSDAWMGGYYPITEDNFADYGELFAEQLYISHEGDDLKEIVPQGTMPLNLFWSFGNNYGYTNVEPLFYEMCTNPESQVSKDYNVELFYKVTLYLNNLRSSLPEEDNIMTFKVRSNFKFQYLGYSPTSHGGKPKPTEP